MIVGIRIVERKRENILVEWTEDGRIRRGWLRDQGRDPTETEVLTAAPFGDAFEEALQPVLISPEDLADALRRRGLWTVKDAMREPGTVARAVAIAAGLSVASLQASLMKLER